MVNFVQNNPCSDYSDKVQVAVLYTHNQACKKLDDEHSKQWMLRLCVQTRLLHHNRVKITRQYKSGSKRQVW